MVSYGVFLSLCFFLYITRHGNLNGRGRNNAHDNNRDARFQFLTGGNRFVLDGAPLLGDLNFTDA